MSPILGIIASGANVAAGAFESIATATGTGSSGTITFSSIPGTYQHLQLRMMGKSTTSSTTRQSLYVQFNSDTSTNYSAHNLLGNGASVSATGLASQTKVIAESFIPTSRTASPALANIMGVGIIDIHDYASTSKNKTVRVFKGLDVNSSSGDVGVGLASGLWISTSAITSITLTIESSLLWTTTSQFALYGIKGA